MTPALEKLCPKGLSFLICLYLLSFSLRLCYADVILLVVLRGVGLEKRGLQTETCALSNTIFTLREGET